MKDKKYLKENDKRKNFVYNVSEARNALKKWWGLEPSLSEGVEIRRIVKSLTENFIEDQKYLKEDQDEDRIQIRPGLEAAMVFMNKNYGTQLGSRDELELFGLAKDADLERKGYDWDESFKLMQEEMHFP